MNDICTLKGISRIIYSDGFSFELIVNEKLQSSLNSWSHTLEQRI